MVLFEVPGWSMPSEPVSTTQRPSKKRKRAGSQDLVQLRSAQVNIDKLINTLGRGTSSHDDESRTLKKKKKNKTTSRPSDDQGREDPRPPKKHGKAKPPVTSTVPTPAPNAGTLPNKKPKKKTSKTESVPQPTLSVNSKPPSTARDTTGLTSLQRNMKKSLDGARFRLINESLYKSDSLEAVKMMKQDPENFETYHIGFRHQVQSWPSNPVSYYISELSSYPPKTVIADLGCGDAALARGLHSKNFNVLSFDLVSDGAYVVEADICSQLPLPGSEPLSTESTEGDAQIVDVVICALSLMSTNWPKCIREAWRVLRPGGELKIAEVASRFSSVDDFTSLISSLGFKFQKKDDRNSHFTLFQFKKVSRAAMSEEEWSVTMSRGGLLKPCEYKRR
ncbi:methyltransferase-domain-containing protein [Melanogaster broomeanus]|nr:methyltransferase-domain-containing protein [Melanogaster broomeanus]